MKNILLPALAALALTTACKKDDTSTPATMQVSGTLASANEVPAVKASAATGTFTGTLDPSSKMLDYKVTFTGLSSAATAGHLHFGDAKHAGDVTVPFSNVPNATSGSFAGMATLTQPQVDSLKAGRLYVNIHTAPYAGGEIRSTLVAK